jgi:ribosome biogenesis GTPase
LQTEDGPLAGVIAGRLRHAARSSADLPAVGDWVAVDPDGGVVRAVLPRRGCVSRAKVDGRSEPQTDIRSEAQILASNVDVVLVVGSLNQDLNIRRIERMLSLAANADAQAVVVLSKADLVPDPWGATTKVSRALGGTVPVITVSTLDGTGLDELAGWLRPGTTSVLIGSSGVGKTTLLNSLAGTGRRTAEVREDDDKGRHATTARELLLLPTGGMVIDTPGIRTAGVWDDGQGVESVFADIASLAEHCRFSDCAHENEPGCAVTEAVADGRLAEDRLEGMRKLDRERERTENRRAVKQRERVEGRQFRAFRHEVKALSNVGRYNKRER